MSNIPVIPPVNVGDFVCFLRPNPFHPEQPARKQLRQLAEERKHDEVLNNMLYDDMGGHFNGYVAIPKGHWLHGKEYMNLELPDDADPHGGITFSGEIDEYPGFWVLGWDTLHFGDTLEKWPEQRIMDETIEFAKKLQAIKN